MVKKQFVGDLVEIKVSRNSNLGACRKWEVVLVVQDVAPEQNGKVRIILDERKKFFFRNGITSGIRVLVSAPNIKKNGVLRISEQASLGFFGPRAELVDLRAAFEAGMPRIVSS